MIFSVKIINKTIFSLVACMMLLLSCKKDKPETKVPEVWNYTIERQMNGVLNVTTVVFTSDRQELNGTRVYFADESKNLLNTTTWSGKTAVFKVTTVDLDFFFLVYRQDDDSVHTIKVKIK